MAPPACESSYCISCLWFWLRARFFLLLL